MPKHLNCVAGTTRLTPVPQSPLVTKLISPEECYKHRTFKVQLFKTVFYLNKKILLHSIKFQQPPSSAPADLQPLEKPPQLLLSLITQPESACVILALSYPKK